MINDDCHRRRKCLPEIGRLTRAPVVILTWNIIKQMQCYQTNGIQFLLDLKMSQRKITLPVIFVISLFCSFHILPPEPVLFLVPTQCSVFTLGKYWSGPGNPPPWSTPKAPPLSALYYSQPAEIFQPSPRPALIGLFRALFDLRPEIQNWQVWWLVWE